MMERVKGPTQAKGRLEWGTLVRGCGSCLQRGQRDLVVRFALEADAVPELEIEQAPDAVVVVAMLGTMFVKEFLDGFPAEVAAIQGARLEEHPRGWFPGAGRPANRSMVWGSLAWDDRGFRAAAGLRQLS